MNSKLNFISGAFLLTTVAIGGCTPVVETRGNLLPESKISKIQPYNTSRYEVIQALGPPTTVAAFDNRTWYYIGETTATTGAFKKELQKRQIIAIVFDEAGQVVEMKKIDPEAAQDIEFVERSTPTAGKDFTIIQQLIGNIGRFSSEQLAE